MARTFIVPMVEVLVPMVQPKGVGQLRAAGLNPFRQNVAAGVCIVEYTTNADDPRLDDLAQVEGIVELPLGEEITQELLDKINTITGGKLAIDSKAVTADELSASLRQSAIAKQALSSYKTPEERTKYLEVLAEQAALETLKVSEGAVKSREP